MTFTAILFTLALGELPPVIINPPGLELCVLQAELCAKDNYQPACGHFDADGMQGCISDYEDCSYDYAEAHEPNCRVSVAWCAMEMPYSLVLGLNDEAAKLCAANYENCPSY